MPKSSADRQIAKQASRNLILLILEGTIQRIGWVFKTESLVIPSVALELGASTALLGVFPAISRLLGFFPQVFYARIIDPLKKKKLMCILLTLGFAACWALIGQIFIWAPESLRTAEGRSYLLLIFILLYACGWIFQSGRMVATAAMRGKLIPVQSRGQLVGMGSLAGGLGSGIIVYWIIKPIIESQDRSLASFGWLFVCVGIGFSVVAGVLALVKEPERTEPIPKQKLLDFLKNAIGDLKKDSNFRRAVVLNLCFVSAFTLMMFYTAYARSVIKPEEYLESVAAFLLVQVLTQAGFAPLMGWIADRAGNRRVLRITSVLSVMWPLSALFLGPLAHDNPMAYIPVYVITGLMLPAHPTMANYLLEIAPKGKQATYVGTSSAVMILAAIFPLVVGGLITWIGYRIVFGGLSVFLLLAVAMAFGLEEPRRGTTPSGPGVDQGLPRPL